MCTYKYIFSVRFNSLTLLLSDGISMWLNRHDSTCKSKHHLLNGWMPTQCLGTMNPVYPIDR